jgi:hypothetical protein
MPPTDPDEDSLFSDPNAIEPLLAAFEAVCRFLQILGPNDPHLTPSDRVSLPRRSSSQSAAAGRR